MSMMLIPGGKDCFNRVALSWSCTLKVYKYLEQRTLNFVTEPVFLIFTDLASLRRAFKRKSLISAICFGCDYDKRIQRERKLKVSECILQCGGSIDSERAVFLKEKIGREIFIALRIGRA
jgi:hypothetical protein